MTNLNEANSERKEIVRQIIELEKQPYSEENQEKLRQLRTQNSERLANIFKDGGFSTAENAYKSLAD